MIFNVWFYINNSNFILMAKAHLTKQFVKRLLKFSFFIFFTENKKQCLGFDSGRGGSGFDSSNSGIAPACTNPGSSKHHQGHDRYRYSHVIRYLNAMKSVLTRTFSMRKKNWFLFALFLTDSINVVPSLLL